MGGFFDSPLRTGYGGMASKGRTRGSQTIALSAVAIVPWSSVTSLRLGGNSPAHVCLNLIAEPLISQHSGFIGCLANLLEYLFLPKYSVP